MIRQPFWISVFVLVAATLRATTWTPQEFGAAVDGVTLDTNALQRAIDAAHIAGGGEVVLRPGRYLTGTVVLRSDVTLHLEKGAVVLGSRSVADYRRGKWPALLLAQSAERIAITGEGEIDGQGKEVAADTVRIFQSGNLVEFFPGVRPGERVDLGADTTVGRKIDPYAMQRDGTLASVVAPRNREDVATWRVDESVRPQLIEFTQCRGVRISGVTLRNAANWVESYRMCDDLEIRGIRVDSTTYWNNDGMDLVNCRRVKIEDCEINAADDGICLKSEPNDDGRGCEDIEIVRCQLRSSASALKLGTASHHAFRRIRVSDIDVRDTYRSAVAIESVDGAVIEDLEISGVRARNTGNAFFLRLGHRNAAKPPGRLRHVVLRDFVVEVPAGKPDSGYPHEGPLPKVATNLAPASIVGLPDAPIEDVVLRNIEITYGGGASHAGADVSLMQLAEVPEQAAAYPEFSMFGELPCWALYLRHAKNVRLENVRLRLKAPDFRPAIVADQVQELVVDRVNVGPGGGAPVLVLARVEGESLSDCSWPADVRNPIRHLGAPGETR